MSSTSTTPSGLRRCQDWPERLAATVALARHKPYQLGTHDCLRFTCQCIETITGVDFWPRFQGYTTRLQALRVIASIAPSLGEAVTAVLGISPQPVAYARRGDVVLYRDAGGEHLGVCVGVQIAVLHEAGLVLMPLRLAEGCWRVG